MNAESADSATRALLWRTDVAMRIIGPVACAIMFVITVYMPFTKQATPALIGVLCTICVMFVIGTWLVAYRPYLLLDPGFLEFRNSGQVYRLKYEDIAKVTVGYLGLRLWLHDGQFLTSKAVQKSNYARVTKERTRGDEVVEQVLSRIDTRRSHP